MRCGLCQQRLIPIHLRIAASKQLDAWIGGFHCFRKTYITCCELLGGTMTNLPWPPNFVADLPVGHAIRLHMPIRSTQFPHWCIHTAIAILNPFGCFFRCARTIVHTNKRLNLQFSAKLNEFIRAKILIRPSTPCFIHDTWALKFRTDCLLPMICTNIITGKPHHACIQFLRHVHNFLANVAHTVRRKQRNMIQPQHAR
ncbi:hypothetical protein D3C85_1082480 [compost metagenome]